MLYKNLQSHSPNLPAITMNTVRVLFVLFLLPTESFSVSTDPKPVKNITVIGTVFCDVCSDNTFSNHSYFLQGNVVAHRMCQCLLSLALYTNDSLEKQKFQLCLLVVTYKLKKFESTKMVSELIDIT